MCHALKYEREKEGKCDNRCDKAYTAGNHSLSEDKKYKCKNRKYNSGDDRGPAEPVSGVPVIEDDVPDRYLKRLQHSLERDQALDQYRNNDDRCDKNG